LAVVVFIDDRLGSNPWVYARTSAGIADAIHRSVDEGVDLL
jgi:hypothetical protein